MHFVKRHPLAVTIGVCLALVAWWWLTPIYGFYAHRGAVALPPMGWSTLPEDVPSTQRATAAKHTAAGDRALAILAQHRARIDAPALSAAVARDGKLIWAGVVGWSDIASRTPATLDTRFRIGSTSKAITATLLARLVDSDDIDLDVSIENYWSALPNEQWRPITLRQLASHMSGLPHYKRNTDLAGLYQTMALRRHYASVTDAVSVFDDSELLHEPGTAFHYSTLGTVLLGATLAEATGHSYRHLVDQHVLAPLNLKSVIVAPSTASGHANLATSYFARDQRFRAWRPVDLSHRLPGGGFAATSSDLAMLGMAWLDPAYISPSTRDAFWTLQVLASGEVNEQGYALGFRWSESQTDDGEVWRHANHGGVSRGAQSWLAILPDRNMAVAINTNRKTSEFGDFAVVYRELVRAFAADNEKSGSR